MPFEKTEGENIHLDFVLCWSYTKEGAICWPSVVLLTGCVLADVEQSSHSTGTVRQAAGFPHYSGKGGTCPWRTDRVTLQQITASLQRLPSSLPQEQIKVVHRTAVEKKGWKSWLFCAVVPSFGRWNQTYVQQHLCSVAVVVYSIWNRQRLLTNRAYMYQQDFCETPNIFNSKYS